MQGRNFLALRLVRQRAEEKVEIVTLKSQNKWALSMATIKQEDLIQSVADALQYISYYHPVDYIKNLAQAYEREQSPAAKDAMAQILINSRMCAEGHRPICQDTGIVTVFLKIGMDVRWDADLTVEGMVDEGVRRAYLHPDNVLRASEKILATTLLQWSMCSW